MSSISFDSEQGRVLVGGRERARMGLLIEDLAWLMHSRGKNSMLSPLEASRAKLEYRYGLDENTAFSERLGWACLIGNDQMKLIAHIHGQCEIHGWVHPDDGEWFADLVERAVADGLLGSDGREGGVNGYGSWQDVADLARRSITPLVSAYSVCEYWPERGLISQYRPDLWTYDEENPDAWYDLSEEERQRIGDEALEDCCPRWQPAEWGTHWSEIVRGIHPWDNAVTSTAVA